MKRARTRLERGRQARERKKVIHQHKRRKTFSGQQPRLCLSRPIDTDGVWLCSQRTKRRPRERKGVPAHNETPAALVQSSDLSHHLSRYRQKAPQLITANRKVQTQERNTVNTVYLFRNPISGRVSSFALFLLLLLLPFFSYSVFINGQSLEYNPWLYTSSLPSSCGCGAAAVAGHQLIDIFH